MRNERYYYSIMPPDHRKAYKQLYEGVKRWADKITVPQNLTMGELQNVYIKLLYDHPLFYYIDQTTVPMATSRGCWILSPKYRYTPEEVGRINQEIREIVDRIKTKADDFRDNPFRLEKCLHDSIVKSVAYDYDALMKTDNLDAHSIVGTFLKKKAVCDGISKAFKLLCNEYGIKCVVALGYTAKNGVFGKDSYHAWNIVKIGEDSYHVDVTWDNFFRCEYPHISYDYFNVTSREIAMDHLPTEKYPECTATGLNYFYSTGSIVSTYEELVDLIVKRYGSKLIAFKASREKGFFQSQEELTEKMSRAYQEAVLKTGRYRKCGLMVNPARNIGKVFFQPEQGQSGEEKSGKDQSGQGETGQGSIWEKWKTDLKKFWK